MADREWFLVLCKTVTMFFHPVDNSADRIAVLRPATFIALRWVSLLAIKLGQTTFMFRIIHFCRTSSKYLIPQTLRWLTSNPYQYQNMFRKSWRIYMQISEKLLRILKNSIHHEITLWYDGNPFPHIFSIFFSVWHPSFAEVVIKLQVAHGLIGGIDA